MSNAAPTSELHDRVTRLLANVLQIDPPQPDLDLIDSGLLDSLGLIELVHALEIEFGITLSFDDLDLEGLRTSTGIAALVNRTTAHAA
jgi:acyl carrier protein